MVPSPNARLTFDRAALERCFLVADILKDDYGELRCEYALLGLAAASDPFHCVATPMLPGQDCNDTTVHQSGHNVLRLRREIRELSHTRGETLRPVAFVHRHPGECDLSVTDDRFLKDVFAPQISTVNSFSERVTDSSRRWCDCRVRTDGAHNDSVSWHIECSIAFSLIVNRQREHSIHALRTEHCPACGTERTFYVPASIAVVPSRAPSRAERRDLRRRLAREVDVKVRFGGAPDIGKASS